VRRGRTSFLDKGVADDGDRHGEYRQGQAHESRSRAGPGDTVVLAEWLRVRSSRVRKRSAPPFCTLDGREIDQSYVRHLLPRLARRAGIDNRVHAHSLRHAYAVALEREGAPLSTIRDLLGHSSAAVTDRYLRRIGASDAVDFARERV
jgi:integrase